MRLTRRVNILGIGVHATHMAETVTAIWDAIEKQEQGYVCVTGVHGIMEAQKDPRIAQILNQAFLNAPDGMPTVWVGRWQGFRTMSRVYGPDLMLELCRGSVDLGYKHFLYGGLPGVAEELRDRLVKRFPGIQIVGTYTPPFRPLTAEEEGELRRIVAVSRPDLFWIGLSTPKQEKFMAHYHDQLDTKLMIGVGAAFDLHTGRLTDAPAWMKQTGMQWFHRLLQEPRRLWKRYLLNNPLFLLKLTGQVLGLKKYTL